MSEIEDASKESLSLAPAEDLYTTRGSYHLRQFVLRLHPDLQQALNSVQEGIHAGDVMKGELPFAWSTYLHETVHWWQHVGTTSGLICSLAYPAQAHLNRKRLKQCLVEVGPKKSILEVLKRGTLSKPVEENLNVLVNNWHDIEFAIRLIRVPSTASSFVNNSLFECVGHSYEILWSAVVWLLSSVLDPHLKVLPDVRKWEPEFAKLKADKVRNHYYGGGVFLPPVDGIEILEGQARFCQLQLLHSLSGGKHDFEDFRRWGYLEGVYRSGFDKFLAAAKVEWPRSIDDPIVGAFLVLCDVALNPTDAFPLDLHDPESFILSVDPGMRFIFMAQEIGRSKRELLSHVKEYSKSEYKLVAREMARSISCLASHEVMPKFLRRLRDTGTLESLLEEDASGKYRHTNRAVRMFVARFLAFQVDKLRRPEYFVWPGMWMVGRNRKANLALADGVRLFDRNAALFVDAPDGEVRARTRQGVKEEDLNDAFHSFYIWNVQYDLVRQWLAVSGPFEFDYGWISKKHTEADWVEWASRHFERDYGVRPQDFEVL